MRAVGSVFHMFAMQAAMPMIVPEAELTRTAGWSQFLQSGSLMAGPVLGAMLMAAFSIPAVMLIDVVGAMVAVGTIAAVTIPDPPRAAGPGRRVVTEMRDGLRVIASSRALKAVAIPMTIATLAYVPVSSLFPLMVGGHLGGTAWHASLVEFLFAGGLLVSSLIMGVWGGAADRFAMISISLGVLGAAVATAGLLPRTGFAAFAVLAGIMGLTGNFFTVPYIALVQSVTPPESLGRVFSLLSSMMTLATPVGLFIAGPVAEVVGVPAWFSVSGIVILLAGGLCRMLSKGLSDENRGDMRQPEEGNHL